MAAAIELEALWNDLCRTEPLALFCGYPAAGTLGPDSADHYGAVCQLRTDVVGGAPADPGSATTRRFPRSVHAPRLVRRFVADTLAGWDLESLSADCVLVSSELATNAIEHANSDFTVRIAQRRFDGPSRRR